jgi:DNA-directed RNA polymerase specialized sigma24 family protein
MAKEKGLTYKEIGQILGIRADAARKRLERARERFKECWEQKGDKNNE